MKYILGVIVLVYLLVLGLFYFFQEFFIFHPKVTASDHQYTFPVNFKETMHETANNGQIHTIHFQQESAKGVVLYLHGNAGNLVDWGWLYKDFLERNYDIIFMDYRGYGKSKGKMSEANLHSDAQHIYDVLKQEYKESDIIVYGRSIGTGIASKLAHSNAPGVLVLESPYFNLKDVVQRNAPFLPINLILRYKLESNKYVPKVSCPIHIMHGKNDGVVPFESGEKLFKVCGENAVFYGVESGTHNDLSQFQEYTDLLNNVLK